MEPSVSLDQAAKALIRALFDMCRESRSYQQDVADVARRVQLEYRDAKKVFALLEQAGYVESLTFGQKVALTDAGLVIAQRLIP